jgi:flagellar hook-basal body complex protein FliE
MLPAISAIAASSASLTNGLTSQIETSMQPAQLSLSPATAGTGLDGTGLDGTNTMPFADLFTDAVGEVNRLQDQAGRTVRGLMTGTGVDVHEAMIATQKASMAFELALAVRNKAVQSYQQVMSMQF